MNNNSSNKSSTVGGNIDIGKKSGRESWKQSVIAGRRRGRQADESEIWLQWRCLGEIAASQGWSDEGYERDLRELVWPCRGEIAWKSS